MDPLQQAHRLALKGAELFDQKEYITAIEHWKLAAQLYEQKKYRDNVSELHVNIAKALQEQAEILFQNNDSDNAIDYYKQAGSIFEGLNYVSDYASCENQIANIYYFLGRNSRALNHYKLAKRVWEKYVNVAEMALSEYCIGLCLTALGNHRKALQCQKMARALIDENEQPLMAAAIELELGKILSYYGKDYITEAIEHTQLALKLHSKQNMPQFVASCESLLGDIYFIKKDYKESLIHFNKAKFLLNIVISQQDKDLVSNQVQMATIETHIGQVYSDMENFKEALSFLKIAEKIFLQYRIVSKVSWVHHSISDCLFKQKKYSEAFKWAKKALNVYKEYGLLREQSLAYRDMGNSLAKMKQFRKAIPNYEKSLQLFELLRGQESSLDFKKSLKKDYLEIYNSLCLSYLVMNEKHWKKECLTQALNYIELSKCSTIAESLITENSLVLCPEMERLFSLEQTLMDEVLSHVSEYEKLSKLCLGRKITKEQYRSSAVSVEHDFDELQKKIELVRRDIVINCSDYGTTSIPRNYNIIEEAISYFPKNEKWHILEFAVLEKMNILVAFLIEPNGSINYEMLYISKETVDIVAQCKDVVQKMREFNETDVNLKLKNISIDLYKAFVPPSIGEKLKSKAISHLMIVPHSYLHWIPFEILFDGEQYWGIKYALSTNYSIDLIRLCISKRQRKIPDGEQITPSFLIIANPLSDLKGSEDEVKKLHKLLEHYGAPARTIERERATKQSFIDEISKGSIDAIHYSGHAQYMGSNPSLSTLYLHTDKTCKACEKREGSHTSVSLTANEIVRKIHFEGAPIIYLSGCETGINEIEPGDEMFGLFRSLMFAGATSFVLSRWLVNDRIAVQFAENFYQHALEGDSLAVALQKARRKVFEVDPSHFANWSAFTIQGDPFRKLAEKGDKLN